MIQFDHGKLVARDPRELARFRRWVLSGQAGHLDHAGIVHENDGRCCHREPWNQTAASIITALKPDVPQVLVNFLPGG